MKPHAASPHFCQYEDNGLKSKLKPSSILKLKDLWKDLMVLQDNLSFTQLQMRNALTLVREKVQHMWPWQIPAEEHEEWARVNATRLRAMARGIQQARLKSPGAAWLVPIVGKSTTQLARPQPESALVATPSPAPLPAPATEVVPVHSTPPLVHAEGIFDDLCVGFEHEHKRAWREKSSTGVKECLGIRVQSISMFV